MITSSVDKTSRPADLDPIESDQANFQQSRESWLGSNLKFLLLGSLTGIVFVKAEILSWYRIQEMFLLESFHMYGVIGSAVCTGALSVWLIRKLGLRTLHGEPVVLPKRSFHKGQIIGGFTFGLGWAITGACPGPLLAQIGAGYWVVTLTFVSALAGTWCYGAFRERFPH